MPSSPTFFTEDDARTLAANIVNFWVGQGYPREVIDVKVETAGSDAVVRSNLRNGTPPGKPDRVAKKFGVCGV